MELLLLLSHFSCVRLCVTPSLGFSRQEHWSGLPFPPPMHKSKSESEVAQSCPTLRDPMDCSLPGSSVHGIFHARVLEWGAIAFSKKRSISCHISKQGCHSHQRLQCSNMSPKGTQEEEPLQDMAAIRCRCSHSLW